MLRGARIEGFRRVGKHIVGELTSAKGPAQWVIHLGMTGRCLVCEPAVEHGKTYPSDCDAGFGTRAAICRSAEVWQAAGAGRQVVCRRREPSRSPPTGRAFVELFKGRKTPIKSALLNQRLLSGIGNIYADESLFRAGVRPRRQAASLTRAELMRLYDGDSAGAGRGDPGRRIVGLRLCGCERRRRIVSAATPGVPAHGRALPGLRGGHPTGGGGGTEQPLLSEVPAVSRFGRAGYEAGEMECFPTLAAQRRARRWGTRICFESRQKGTQVDMSYYAIGVDLGGTNLRVAAVDEGGKMLTKIDAGDRGFAGTRACSR